MTPKKDFLIDRRVDIALDALTPRQKKALEPLLSSRESFVAHTSDRLDWSRRLSSGMRIYRTNARQGLMVFYSKVGDEIVILDVTRKAALDSLVRKKRSKAPSMTKTSG